MYVSRSFFLSYSACLCVSLSLSLTVLLPVCACMSLRWSYCLVRLSLSLCPIVLFSVSLYQTVLFSSRPSSQKDGLTVCLCFLYLIALFPHPPPPSPNPPFLKQTILLSTLSLSLTELSVCTRLYSSSPSPLSNQPFLSLSLNQLVFVSPPSQTRTV